MKRSGGFEFSADDRMILAKYYETGEVNYLTGYYFGGWSFMPWQSYLHHSTKGDCQLLGGVGCLGHDAPILNPITGEETAIGELALLQKNIWVTAWDGVGFVAAKATAPFKKGTARLYRVTLSNGSSIIATMEHRFLSLEGFLPLRLLGVGQVIGVLPTWDRTIHGLGAHHYSERPEGSLASCLPCSHQCDGQLLLGEGDDRVSPRLSDDVPECSRWPSLLNDHLGRGQAHSHLCPLGDRPSSSDLARQALRLLGGEGYPPAPFGGERAPHLAHQSPQQSWSTTNRAQQTVESRQPCRRGEMAFSGSDPLDACPEAEKDQIPCACGPRHPRLRPRSGPALHDTKYRAWRRVPAVVLSLFPTSEIRDGSPLVNTPYQDDVYCSAKAQWCQIDSIECVGNGDFYDLHVPGYNNYVAAGMVHHNSGKTVYKAASTLINALLNFNYGFMDLAPTSWQAGLMFRAMKILITDNPFSKFLAKPPVERPWPYILLKNGSLIEFRSASDLNLIQGWEGDQMNLDEAGVLRDVDDLLLGTASRLRGTTSYQGQTRGRHGRLEFMSAIYAGADWLYNRYDAPKLEEGATYTEHYSDKVLLGQALHMLEGPDAISMTVASASNVGLQEIDLVRMRRRIPTHLQEQALEGRRPTGSGIIFTPAMMDLCEDWSLNAMMEAGLRDQLEGFDEIVVPAIGPVLWRLPFDPTRVYMMVGDPGPGNPPLRNAAVVIVLDITDCPKKPATLVCFRWIAGAGTYNPFLTAYFEEFNRYRPQMVLAEATGPQKGFGSMVYSEWGIPVDGIDLSGMKKSGGIAAATLLMSRGLVRFPYISGIRSQMSGYVLPDKDIAQDIVSTFIVAAIRLRTLFGLESAIDLTGKRKEKEGVVVPQRQRAGRSPNRSRRSPNAGRRR